METFAIALMGSFWASQSTSLNAFLFVNPCILVVWNSKSTPSKDGTLVTPSSTWMEDEAGICCVEEPTSYSGEAGRTSRILAS